MRRILALLVLEVTLAGCALDRSGLGGEGAADAGDSTVDAQTARDADRPDSSRPDDAGPRNDGFVPPDDAGPPPDDAGVAPTDFYDLDWGPERRVTLGGPDACGDRHSDPILSHDMRWLFVGRWEMDCRTRRFNVFEWRAGSPRHVGVVGPIVSSDSEHNGHVMEGALAGRPGDTLLFYTRNGAMTDQDMMYVWLTGDPPLTHETPTPLSAFNGPMNQSGPNSTLAGDRFVFEDRGDVLEATGSPPVGWGPTRTVAVAALADRSEVDPSLSPDGRVLVWISRAPADPSTDLWVARRRAVSDPFTGRRRLSRYSTTDYEFDAYIAPNGDLLFTRRTSGVYGVFRAPAVFP